MIELHADDLSLELCPEIGGSVRSLSFRDINLLRRKPDDLNDPDPRDMAAFPMVPFVGRIRHGAFNWHGQHIQLPANMPPEPHAIHGFGWQSNWTVEAVDDRSAVLWHINDGSDWPWSYEASQTFVLDAQTLLLTLRLINTSSYAMPAGLGWHPYFPSERATLYASTQREALLPNSGRSRSSDVEMIAKALPNGCEMASVLVDNVFEISSRDVRITWPTHTLTMTSEPAANYLTVYSPTGAHYFCAEPITHIPGAHNLPTPTTGTSLIELSPDEEISLSIMIRFEPSGS